MSETNNRLLSNPPEKVRLMYQAVIELINDNCNINSIKVVDITSRAGIGKGTAYEYFTSKEEIITKALVYDMMEKVDQIKEIADSENGFESKVKNVLDYVEKHFHENRSFCQLFKMSIGSYDVSNQFFIEYEKLSEYMDCEQLASIADQIMDCGVVENIIAEENRIKRRMVFYSQVVSYSMLLLMNSKNEDSGMSSTEGKQFTYECIVKALQ